MENIIHATIGGVSFQLEDNAHKAISTYLSEIRTRLKGRKDADEIANDIEARVAEILVELNTGSAKPISEDIIAKVIERIGQPDQIEFGEGQPTAEKTSYQERYTRRLYRDTSNGVFAGVCSGLGVYFNSDPILFRVIFLVLFFIPLFHHHHHWGNGFIVLTYIILWIIMPKAKSHRQLMEMHGKPFNMNSVKDNVAQEFKEASNSVKARTGHGGFIEKLGVFLGELLHIIGRAFVIFFKVLFGIFSVIFITIGVSLIVALFAVMFFDTGSIVSNATTHCNIYIQELASIFIGTDGFWGITIPATVLILIPTLGLIYLGLRLAFKFKSNDRLIGFTALGVWLAALCIGMVFGFSQIKDFRNSSWIKTAQNISTEKSDTLIIRANDTAMLNDCCNFNGDDDDDYEDQKIYLYSDGKTLLWLASLNIENGKEQPLSASLDRFACGEDKATASKNAEAVDISVTQQGNTINLDPVMSFSKTNKWRFQKGYINLTIPEGTIVFFDPNTKKLLENSPNSHTYVSGYMSGKYYKMLDNGLQEIGK